VHKKTYLFPISTIVVFPPFICYTIGHMFKGTEHITTARIIKYPRTREQRLALLPTPWVFFVLSVFERDENY